MVVEVEWVYFSTKEAFLSQTCLGNDRCYDGEATPILTTAFRSLKRMPLHLSELDFQILSGAG